MKYIDMSYEDNSKILEQIISNQKQFFDKIGIGYKKNTDEASSSMMTGNEEKPRSYAEVVKDSTNEEGIECQPEQPIPKEGPTERQDLRRTTPSFVPRYGHFFYGYCFTCGRFGHKIVNCFQRRKLKQGITLQASDGHSTTTYLVP